MHNRRRRQRDKEDEKPGVTYVSCCCCTIGFVLLAVALSLGLTLGLILPSSAVVTTTSTTTSTTTTPAPPPPLPSASGACNSTTDGTLCDPLVDGYFICNASSTDGTEDDTFICTGDALVLFNTSDPTGTNAPLINAITGTFTVDVAGSTATSGHVYQIVVTSLQVSPLGSLATFFDSSFTNVTFPSPPLDLEIIYHRYYNGPDTSTATLVAETAKQVRVGALCLEPIGFDGTIMCWDGSDYCVYPMELDGFYGTTVSTFDEVAAYVNATLGPGSFIDLTTGCWNQLVDVDARKRSPTSTLLVRTGIIAHYMIFTSTAHATTNVTTVPLSGYNVDIDWGDADTVDWHVNDTGAVSRTHTYINATTARRIRLSGTASALVYSRLASGASSGKLVDIQQWGLVVTQQMDFYDELRLGSLVVSAVDAPNPSLTDVTNLFGTSATISTRALYGTRVATFAAWSLPNVVGAAKAFNGMNLSTAPATLFGSALATASTALAYAILPTNFTLIGCTLTASNSMFKGALITGATFESVTLTGSAAVMFNVAVFTTSAVSFNGINFAGVTNAASLFQDASFTHTPIMSTIALTSATTATSAFSGINRLPNLPVLGLSVAVGCNGLLYVSTIVERFVPEWPLMKCTDMTIALAATYQLGADFSAMNVSRVVTCSWTFTYELGPVASFGADSVFPGRYDSCTSARSYFGAVGCTAAVTCLFNVTALSFPVATSTYWFLRFPAVKSRFTNMPNLDLSQCTSCSSMFGDFGHLEYTSFVERFVPSWPNMKCTDASYMFYRTRFLAGADFSGMNVAQVVTATGMFLNPTFSTSDASILPGPFSSAITVTSAFASPVYTVAPITTAIAFPVAVTLTNAMLSMPISGTLPSNFIGNSAVTCTDLFRSSSFTLRFAPVWSTMRCTTATTMFWAAAFAAGADLSAMNVALVVTATGMLQGASFSGGVASIMPGPFPAATEASFMLSGATYATAPDMTLISIPVATTANNMFASCSKLTAMPNLQPVSVVTGTNMFSLATISADMGASTLAWSFPALQTATSMFQGTNFGSFPFYMHTWGMGNVQTLSNFANTAANVPSTINVGPWQMQQLLIMTGAFYGLNNPSLVLNFTLWQTPRLTTMISAFSNLGNVQLIVPNTLDVSRVTDMTSLFASTPMTSNIVLNGWNTSSVILAGSAFSVCIGTTVNVSAWSTANIVTATTMFTTSNMSPDMTTWSWASLVSASNILSQCYMSTPRIYSNALNAFALTSSLAGITMGGPRSNLLDSTSNTPTRVLQGYDSTGSTSRATLISRSWILSDIGLL